MSFADDQTIQEQVKTEFEAAGFAIAPNVLDADTVSALRDRLKALYYKEVNLKEAPLDAHRLQIWRHQEGGEASFLHIAEIPEVAGILKNKKLMTAFAKCVGATHLQSFEAVALIKPTSQDQVFAWHSDYPLFPYQTQDYATLWIAVTECNEETGGMSMAKTSFKHDWSPVNVKSGAIIENNRSGETPPDNPEAQGMPVSRIDMAPGDAVIFHANTLHKSEANTSPDLRIGLAMRFALRPIQLDEGKEPIQAAFTKQVEWDSEGFLKNTKALPVIWPNEWQS
mgnify:CR=1 FL=1